MKTCGIDGNVTVGVRTVSSWAATLVCIASFSMSNSVLASNPWGRAVGEAQGLHDVTEDLRNRASRLFPTSPATRIACALDESACRILEMVKHGADWGQLQMALESFEHLNTHLCRAIAADCNMSRDRTIANYIRVVEDRFGDLVRDLSKCKRPVSVCPSPYDSYYPPQYPTPYPHYGDEPRIPQHVPTPRSVERYDPRFVNPNLHPAIPDQWQGSMPRNSYYPNSTYDFDTMATNRDHSVQSQVGNLVPVDRRAVENERVERPVASEILGLLMSRALR